MYNRRKEVQVSTEIAGRLEWFAKGHSFKGKYDKQVQTNGTPQV